MSFSHTYGDEKNEYDVSNIPPGLHRDADAVIRKDILVLDVKGEDESTVTITYAVTVFNKEGQRKFNHMNVGYDKFREIEDLDGAIYDASGEKIRSLESEDIKDYSEISGFSIFEDSRVKKAELFYDKFPYTVEFTYKILNYGFVNFPAWIVHRGEEAVEYSHLEVIVPDDYKLRYWCNRDSVKPVITKDMDKITYVWGSKDLPEQSEDVVANDYEDYTTVVILAPSSFEIDDYKGDASTWESLGEWSYELSKGADVLPEKLVEKVHSLISPNDDVHEKIKKLYQFLQSTTRYANVTLGIGGWKPYNAKYVYENGYGDCKALSNYMVALLKEAGIKAYPVLIDAGERRFKLITQFPSEQFNHVIVCVPLPKDTVWLECTDQIGPYNHLGAFTENRNALMFTENGGVLIHTPKTTFEDNTQNSSASVKFNSFGNAEIKCTIKWFGDEQDDVRGNLELASSDDKDQWVDDALNAPNITNMHYTLDALGSHLLNINLSASLISEKYASVTGDRIFFKPSLIHQHTYIPMENPHRLSPVYMSYPYLDADSVLFLIPDGYKVEALPNEINLNPTFGTFVYKTTVSGDSAVVFHRKLIITDYKIPAKEYKEYRKFWMDVVKADRANVVLVKNN
jgi:hypothetical protein